MEMGLFSPFAIPILTPFFPLPNTRLAKGPGGARGKGGEREGKAESRTEQARRKREGMRKRRILFGAERKKGVKNGDSGRSGREGGRWAIPSPGPGSLAADSGSDDGSGFIDPSFFAVHF